LNCHREKAKITLRAISGQTLASTQAEFLLMESFYEGLYVGGLYMFVFGLPLFGVGWIGTCLMILSNFSDNLMWAGLCLIPFVAFFYALIHFRECHIWLGCMLPSALGYGIITIGTMIWGMPA
jgi:hypothetical protein